MAHNEAISILLGYASIASWLGAQFPQIVVNLQRKSVDGLALPFLVNWLIGDSTNLIGCILTDQLPFQTALAIYFVLVDTCLVTQYVYYDASRDAKALSVLTSVSARHSRASLISPNISQSPERYITHRRTRSRSRSYSVDPELRAAVATMALATSEVPPENMALPSEVEHHPTHGRRRQKTLQRASSLEGLPESVVAETRDNQWGGRRLMSDADEDSDEIPSAMFDSFRSEGGGGGRSKGKHVSWTGDSLSRDRARRQLSYDEARGETEETLRIASPSGVRGRPLTRSQSHGNAGEPSTEDGTDLYPPRERRLSAASVVSAGASRRSASIVFLGVLALFGFSSQSGLYGSTSPSTGVVLNAPQTTIPSPALAHPINHFTRSHSSSDIPASLPTLRSDFNSSIIQIQLADSEPSFTTTSSSDTQRVVGRISAWTCTTLYLTSRLPQIWKNYARKSVEGLSIYLFIFAFMGNFFYVLSILTSPKLDQPEPQAKQFLRESIPYLLGSGGTLCFDVTIVIQSLIYAPNRRLFRSKSGSGRRKSLSRAVSDEERGLLADEE
ncbi:hypothetical protein M422DRAFT_24878 [Sphaerobolus stellatus SS14]|nr:hypothetical protein M422DRAFT_24878 [Sphaerobolus stellatus SS14]